jgi:SAM-dependent methyltransferase
MKLTQTRPALLIRHFLRTVEIDGLGGTVAQAWRRVSHSLGSHGLRSTLARAVRSAPASPGIAAPAPPEAPHPFDLLHATDTAGCYPAAALPPTSLSALLITGYIGIGPSALVQAIAALPLRPGDFSFVDLGCGKGRAVLIAAQFPFRRILGVELDPELCRIARANLALKPDWAARISVLQQDAASVIYPDGPLLVFLFHPFFPRILRRVLANLERQLRRSPREAWLLYANNPRYTRVLRRFPFLREVSETRYPLTPEDAAVNYFELPYERFTLYSVDLTHFARP